MAVWARLVRMSGQPSASVARVSAAHAWRVAATLRVVSLMAALVAARGLVEPRLDPFLMAGEQAEERVLRLLQNEHGPRVEPEIETAHHRAADAVAHHHRAGPRGYDLGQHRGRAPAKLEVGLTAGRAVAVRVGAPVGQRRRMRDLDLPPAETLPFAIAEFGQPRVVAPLAGIESQLTADDLRSLAHAAERAAQEDRRPGLSGKLDLQRTAHGERLGAAALGEIGILGALHAPLGVPRRLAVAQHVERDDETGRRRHVRRRITILAAP